jgi:hypothetical protein
MGLKAERCYQMELGRTDSFLAFGFDTLKKGLKTVDSLQSGLHIMSTSYLDKNRREYELAKNISLRMLDPRALITLKKKGKTAIAIPETIFDLDYPGHYMRRHKSASISIPCVAGPYTSISCKFSLINNRYRHSTELLTSKPTEQQSYDEKGPGNDPRFTYNVGSIQSIAISTCTSDSGLFNLNFEDNRYLPFEATGAIAIWTLEFPSAFPAFDFCSIADVVLHIRYTAREGGITLVDTVRRVQREEVNGMLNAAKKSGLFQLLYRLKQTFPVVWNQVPVSIDWKTLITLKVTSLPFL